MTSLPNMVTPPEIAAEASHRNHTNTNSNSSPSSRSASVVSSTSLARWRLAQDRHTTPQGSPNESLTTFDKYRSEERRSRRVPQVVFTDLSEQEKPSTRACGSPDEPTAAAESPVYSNSVEERSYRAVVSDHVRRSPSDAHLRTEAEGVAAQSRRRSVPPTHTVAGDEPVRWSFSYSSSAVHGGEREGEEEDQLHEVVSNGAVSPAAIAAAVPAIAEARNAAAAACADRWTDEVRQSTTAEASMLRAYRQLEVQLHEAERRLNSAEARQQKEVAALKAELEKEREGRVKAEHDREELLNQAALSPPLATPRGGGGQVVHNILHVDAEVGQRSQSLASGSGAHPAAATATTTTTYISETFYEKMKEREERARAQVRKEFVRQAQESVYAEQKKTAEAEKAAALATRQLNKAEADLKASQEALQEATSVLEAKDVQLHERAIHIQELEAQLRLVQRQLESAERAGAQAEQQARRKLEEAQNLADMRQSELEAQRGFAHQLQAQLGMKTKDLFDQEADRESVLQVVVGLQTRCAALERDLEISVKETTALLDQRRQHAESEAQLLREHTEEVKQRCAAAEAELAAMKGKHVCDATELVLLRQRYEKDLEEQRVEVRSLELQLENVLAAARQKSSNASSATEVERQQQAALLRQYAADTAAAREELDRARAALQRENEKHLRTVLELSQQLTALRQANTRLEHTANVREHESAEATQLLARARDELSQLRDERRRLSRSLVDVREDSRMRSLMDGPDMLQRRVAELENVRRDLHEKLQQANNTIEDMQQQQQQACVMEWSRRDSLLEGERRVVSDRQHTRNSRLQVSAPESRAAVEGSGNSRARQPSQVSIASTPASLGLPELLVSMGEQLEPILRPSAERRHEASAHSLEGQTRGASSASSVPPTLRERRQQHSLALEEGEKKAAKALAVDAAWLVGNNTKAAAAAQRGRVTSPDVVDSPSRPFAMGEEGQRLERGGREDVPPSSPEKVGSQQQKWMSDVGVIKTANVPSAHAPPSRPRRSSQASLSSYVVTDDLAGQRWGHRSDRSISPPLPKPQRGHAERAATSAHRQHQQPVAERVSLIVPPSVDLSPIQQEKRNASEKANTVRAAEARERDELESEPCWESEHHHQLDSDASSSVVHQTPAQDSIEEVCTPSRHSAQRNSPPPPSSLVESQPAAPLQHGPTSAGVNSRAASQRQWRSNEVSSLVTTPSPPAVVVVEAAVPLKEEESTILRYARIPAEALFPVGRVNSADVVSVAATPPPQTSSALLKDAETPLNLFSNVQYVSSVLSSSPLPLPAAQGHARTAATSAGPVRGSQYRATIPDGALVIDVHKSTPPPVRRRAQVK